MWFKQAQILKLSKNHKISSETLSSLLENLAFQPCLPSHASTAGWAPPVADTEDESLVLTLNECLLFCLQVEEKILPATVVRQELDNRIKQIQAAEDRKVRQSERKQLKDDVTAALLPRAFSRMKRIYAYFDLRHHWLVIGTNNQPQVETLLGLLKRSVTSLDITSFETKKLAPVLTDWLQHQSYPSVLGFEQAALLQDPQQSLRRIRLSHQTVDCDMIRGLLSDGYQLVQASMAWQDHLSFTLTEGLKLSNIKPQEVVLALSRDEYSETEQQRMASDFFIMSNTFRDVFKELLGIFTKDSRDETVEETELVAA